MPSPLSLYPFVRLLIPLMLGILCGNAATYHPLIGTGSTLSLLTDIMLYTVAGALLSAWLFRHRPIVFGLSIHLLFFALGFALLTRFWQTTDIRFASGYQTYLVKLTEHPQEKPKSLLFEAEAPMQSHLDKPCKLLLYFAKDSAARCLRRGDELWIKARLSLPEPIEDANSRFDYGRYLRRRSIAGSGYVAANRWKVVRHHTTRTWRQKADDARLRCVSLYRRLHIGEEETAVLSAITLGYKADLSEPLKQTYSHTGASHVLALSGLHIGLIYLLLHWLLMPLGRRSMAGRIGCALLIIILLGIFAFFTGASSSVTRSVIMFSVLILSQWQTEEYLSFNSLAFAAFIMLLFSPQWLFDVGFQLSFSAVSSILLVNPHLSAQWHPSYWLTRKVWSLLTLSFSAQIGVAPLVLYYFHTFSTHFLLTNLWVIPLITLVLYTAVVFLLLTPLPALQSVCASCLDALLGLQHMGLRQIESWHYATLTCNPPSVLQVLSLYAVIATAIGFCLLPSKQRCQWCLGSFLACLVLFLF